MSCTTVDIDSMTFCFVRFYKGYCRLDQENNTSNPVSIRKRCEYTTTQQQQSISIPLNPLQTVQSDRPSAATIPSFPAFRIFVSDLDILCTCWQRLEPYKAQTTNESLLVSEIDINMTQTYHTLLTPYSSCSRCGIPMNPNGAPPITTASSTTVVHVPILRHAVMGSVGQNNVLLTTAESGFGSKCFWFKM